MAYVHTPSTPIPAAMNIGWKQLTADIFTREENSPGSSMQTSLIAGNKGKARIYKKPAFFTQGGTNSVVQTLLYNRCARAFLSDKNEASLQLRLHFCLVFLLFSSVLPTYLLLQLITWTRIFISGSTSRYFTQHSWYLKWF